MTGRTRSARVFRMIEARVETLQRRKRFDLSALHVRVTDRADRTRRVCELLLVTTGAGRMCSFAGQRGLRRVVLTPVAKQTGKPRVLAIVVFELRVVGRRRLLRCVSEDDSVTRDRCFQTQLVTRIAIRRQRRELTLLVVTGEAKLVSRRQRLVKILILVLLCRKKDNKLGSEICSPGS